MWSASMIVETRCATTITAVCRVTGLRADRSLASVVENRLIGIIGNALVLPVAYGVHLDPRFVPEAGKELPDLLAHYKPRVVFVDEQNRAKT